MSFLNVASVFYRRLYSGPNASSLTWLNLLHCQYPTCHRLAQWHKPRARRQDGGKDLGI